MKTVTKIFMVSLLCLVASACGKKSSSVATAPAVTQTEAGHWVGNKCYNSANVEIAVSNCPSTGSGGYRWNNQYQACYSIATGQQVNPGYCMTGGAVCSGFYWYIDNRGGLWGVTCDGVSGSGNCSGYDLIKGTDGSYQFCL